jgi:hypothetical protein
MATLHSLRRTSAVLAAILLVPAAVIAACSSNNSNPSPGNGNTYNVPETGSQQQGSDDSGPGSQKSDDAGGGSPVDAPLTQKDGALVTDAASCETDSGCWACSPTTPSQFLNQCTGSTCFPFPASSFPAGYDGSLPPLN